MRKTFLALLGACALLTGCASQNVVLHQSEQTEITLAWWGNDKRNEYTIEAVQQFEALHPDIKVHMSYSEWSGYESRNRIQMVAATEADVMQINFGWLPEFSPDGEGYYDIESLAEFVDLTNFDEAMLAYGRRDGILNAVPIAMNAETVYLNKTIYDRYSLEIPETWEDFEHAAEVMSPDGVYPLSAPSKGLWLYTIAYAEQVTGRQFLREDGTLNFTADELRIMLEFYERMVEKKVFPQAEYYDRVNIDNRNYAGVVAWVSDANNYLGAVMEQGDEVVVAPYTHSADCESGDGWYAKPATLYAISKDTDHPEESAMLLDFLLNSSEMASLQGVEKGVPLSLAAREALTEEGLLDGLQYEASLCMEQNENLEQMNSFVENADMIDCFIAAANLLLYDKATPEEAANSLYVEIKENF